MLPNIQQITVQFPQSCYYWGQLYYVIGLGYLLAMLKGPLCKEKIKWTVEWIRQVNVIKITSISKAAFLHHALEIAIIQPLLMPLKKLQVSKQSMTCCDHINSLQNFSGITISHFFLHYLHTKKGQRRQLSSSSMTCKDQHKKCLTDVSQVFS